MRGLPGAPWVPVLRQHQSFIVVNKRPWHYAGGTLRPHDHALHEDFPETVLQLCRAQGNRAVWWSEEPLEITSIKKSDLDLTDGGPYPFTNLETEVVEDDLGRKLHIVRSSVPKPEADGHKYKIVFTIGGEPIDPDMSCNP